MWEDDNSVKKSDHNNFAKAHDYHFRTAENGEVAILEAASHNPEIMLLDLGLPDIDGIWSNKKSADMVADADHRDQCQKRRC